MMPFSFDHRDAHEEEIIVLKDEMSVDMLLAREEEGMTSKRKAHRRSKLKVGLSSMTYIVLAMTAACYPLTSVAKSVNDWKTDNSVQSRQRALHNNYIRATSGSARGTMSRRRELQRSSGGRAYQTLSSEEIEHRVQTLASTYPHLINVTTAQAKYGLQAAGGTNDCAYDTTMVGCANYILTIQDTISHPLSSRSDATLPTVVLLGAFHGNERVGPTAVIETADLLLQATHCESHPPNNDGGCRQSLSSTYGLNDYDRMWLARLVCTRRIIIVPTANAVGYFQDTRRELGVDPNRDFSYDVAKNASGQMVGQCMQTIAARVVNEVFRDYIVYTSLTFHAGMTVIAYEWGNPTYYDPVLSANGGLLAPDDTAQKLTARAYSTFAGGIVSGEGTKGAYPYGSMNSLVYPVNGGMEDWSYAASWDTKLSVTCNPTTFGGYSANRTMYTSSQLRSHNMLVETSNVKSPPQDTLGSTLDALNPAGVGNGNVNRNIRLSLASIDLPTPYCRILSVGEKVLTTDVTPYTPPEDRLCNSSSLVGNNTIEVSGSNGTVEILWTVGGALDIDATSVIALPFQYFLNGSLDCDSQFTQDELNQLAKDSGKDMQEQTSPQSGRGQLNGNGAFPLSPSSSNKALPSNVPIFSATVDVSSYKIGEVVALMVLARVDQSWSQKPSRVVPANIPPQTHLVNARTNTSWYHEVNGHIVQGRTVWKSSIVTMKKVE